MHIIYLANLQDENDALMHKLQSGEHGTSSQNSSRRVIAEMSASVCLSQPCDEGVYILQGIKGFTATCVKSNYTGGTSFYGAGLLNAYQAVHIQVQVRTSACIAFARAGLFRVCCSVNRFTRIQRDLTRRNQCMRSQILLECGLIYGHLKMITCWLQRAQHFEPSLGTP